MRPIYSLSATFISYFFTVRSACKAIISPMSLTFSFEIGSAKSSPSLRYFPFENFVTNISILSYTSELICLFRQEAKVHRTVNISALNSKSAEVNGAKQKSLRLIPMLSMHRKSRARKPSYPALMFLVFCYTATILRPLTSARTMLP